MNSRHHDPLAAFDFQVPQELIALRPARPRASARMLCVGEGGGGELRDRLVADFPAMVRAGDVVVVNDTRVIPASLTATRPPRGADGESVSLKVLLTEYLGGELWNALIRPSRRLRLGDTLTLTRSESARIDDGTVQTQCAPRTKPPTARAVAREGGGNWHLEFDRDMLSLLAVLRAFGSVPLPPYIQSRRGVDEQDTADYQTVYADKAGAVAAPTAGLHVTQDLLQSLHARDVTVAAVTLHTALGTFAPVGAAEIASRRLHSEYIEIKPEVAELLNEARRQRRRIIAVGTTTLRTLETSLRRSGDGKTFCGYSGTTDLFLQPGDSITAAEVLFTNFHLPRSSLFMLVCAFAGRETMHAAYAHAIAQGYRFFSYGDASWLCRGGDSNR